MNSTIVGIGEALWDVFLKENTKRIGGAPANFAYHASQFGFESYAVSAIGDDELGNGILHNFDEKGLNYLIEKVDKETGSVLVRLDSNNETTYEIKENVAWDFIPYTDQLAQLAQRTKVVCFGSLAQRNAVSRDTINRFIEAIPTANEPLIVYDINLRQNFYSKEILQSSFEKSNILKLNDSELDIISKMFEIPFVNPIDRCRILLSKFNFDIVILTCGDQGSRVITKDSYYVEFSPKVEVKSTVGAGDSFTASFVASLLKGKSVAEAQHTATQVSAYVCTEVGAMPKLSEGLTL